jgi:hypothetical protein
MGGFPYDPHCSRRRVVDGLPHTTRPIQMTCHPLWHGERTEHLPTLANQAPTTCPSSARASQEPTATTGCRQVQFEVKSTKYPGFIFEAGKGVRMDPAKVKAILVWQAPTSARGVQSFRGFANFYQRFIRNFSDIVRPLTALTHKGAPFVWEDEQANAFESMKKMFTTVPILMQFETDRRTVVKTDASNWATGATMSQYDDDGVLRPSPTSLGRIRQRSAAMRSTTRRY